MTALPAPTAAASRSGGRGSGRRVLPVLTGALAGLLQVTATVAMTTAAGLLVWSMLPLAFGWQASAVVSGSMHPQIRVGDVVLTSPPDDVQVEPGMVVMFPDPSGLQRHVMHRVAEVDEQDRLITRGDANQSADSTPLERGTVEGIGRLRVPLVGMPRVWFNDGNYPPLIALAVLLTLATTLTLPPSRRGETDAAPQAAGDHTTGDTKDDAGDEHARDDTDHDDDRPATAGDADLSATESLIALLATDPRTGAPTGAPVEHRRRAITTISVAVSLAVLVPATVPTDAHARFTAATPTGTNTFTAATVVLSHDRSSALFTPGSSTTSASPMRPGDAESVCLTTTYTGPVPATVRLRAVSGSSGTLGSHLDLRVEGPVANCAAFDALASHASAVTEPLNTFLANRTSWTNGVGSWAPTAGGQTQAYRISYRFTRGASGTGKTATFALALEARTS
ncbi:signal peptidase I [Kineococcus xinjiangensis]|uniref:Signal peptidase I n=1 Tax=Kineococcus xinjiangensis TaxID=512762 RepID=A0A2S6IDY3_9ACTN|nr:signal peptidase I [Kineococcus xinjiangensis]PPK92407.1 signal peptidase I [Kineococcus xinjiangensis]